MSGAAAAMLLKEEGAQVTVLDSATAAALERLCDLLVPGSSRVGPAVYIDALLGQMDPEQRGPARRLAAHQPDRMCVGTCTRGIQNIAPAMAGGIAHVPAMAGAKVAEEARRKGPHVAERH